MAITQKQQGNKRKILMAALGVITSVAVLGSAGFAWYTLSTNPEISGMSFTLGSDEGLWISKDGEEFYKHVDISDKMAGDMKVLRPVSTFDGLNWYVCDYEASSGNIVEDEFFLKQWCISEEHGTLPAHDHCDNGGFYAYTDIWVKTTKDVANVRLAIPDLDERYEEELTSGCYVLSYYTAEDKDGNKSIKLMQEGPETCARVGFMVFDPTTGDEEPVILQGNEDARDKIKDTGFTKDYNFFIYEPNADTRSELDKQSDRYLTDIYVSKLRVKDQSYFTGGSFTYAESNGMYLQTYPIKQTVAHDPDTADLTDERGILEKADPALFPADHLIIQRGVKWNEAAIKEQVPSMGFTDSPVDLLNSLMRNIFTLRDETSGRFVNSPSGLYTQANTYSPTTLSGDNASSATSQIMFQLQQGEIRQIRLFFWIEGQDIDCWNDVAGLEFLTRIEFATQ